VLAWVPHPELGASGRYRVFQFRPLLAAEGVDVEIHPFFDDAAVERLYRPGVTAKIAGIGRGLARRWRDLPATGEVDVVLIHREICPIAGLRGHEHLRRRGARWVFDFDDAVFLPNVSEANKRFAWIKPFAELGELASGARAVSAGNAWLADWARSRRPGRPPDEVEVIPTSVDTEAWKPRRRNGGPPRLVWIGSPSTAPYLEAIRPALERLGRRRPDLEFHVIGAAFAAENLRVVVHPWSPDREVEVAGACDIGLSPLPDTDWSRGKWLAALLRRAAAAGR
jgi:glycosyltransferase involved in cell wall biosynthesis